MAVKALNNWRECQQSVLSVWHRPTTTHPSIPHVLPSTVMWETFFVNHFS